jgi:RecA-family ATPase/uncharacterized protein YdhG (YjbR/CyaY superfamily)
MKATIFQDFTNPCDEQDLFSIFETIKSTKYESEINSIRLAFHQEDKLLGDELKKKLPAFTPSGTFSYRNADSLVEYNQIIHLDFDDLEYSELKTISDKINACSYTFASFISPKGKGLKVFVKTNSTSSEHKETWSQLTDFYKELIGLDSDTKCKDICRLCFFSHDKNLFLNTESEVFQSKNAIEEQTTLNPEQIKTPKSLEFCNDFTNKKSEYMEGNRNNHIFLFAANANRFGIPENETLEYLLNTFDLNSSEIRASVKSAYKNIADFAKYKFENFTENQTIENSLISSNGLHFHSIEDLILRSQNEPPIPTLYSGIKIGSFGFIFGPSKSGKTTFAENMAMSIASGQEKFFNKPLIGGAKKVLFISMEEYWQPRTERNAKQLDHLQSALNSNYCSVDEKFPRLINAKEDWELLKMHIKESNAEIVFIDSLSRLYSGCIEESSLAKELLLKLRELTNEYKITLIIIHHTPKQVGKPLTIDSMAGSRVLAQEADFMIGISRTPDGTRYMKEVAFRYAQENDETVTTFVINSNAWLVPGSQVSEFSLLKNADGRADDSNAESIFEVIEESTNTKGLITTSELLSLFVESKIMSKPTLYANLNKLETKGKIEKLAKGQYRVKP